MKGEIVEKLENTKEVSEEIYHKIVDSVAAAYTKSGKVGAAEVAMFAEGLKRQWKNFAGKKGAAKKSAAKKAPAKKTAKKSAKKTS